MTTHRIAYCALCDCQMVICGTCGNNSCNGGHGLVDGHDCPDCDSAYELQSTLEPLSEAAAAALALGLAASEAGRVSPLDLATLEDE